MINERPVDDPKLQAACEFLTWIEDEARREGMRAHLLAEGMIGPEHEK